jgi:hypothetical protein
MKRLLKFRATYSGQILVYDSANIEDTITLDYCDAAYRRGYAITTGALAFFPIVQDGLADLSVWSGRPESTKEYDTLAEASLSVKTGELCIHEPEDEPVILAVSPGEYDVVFAQKKTDIEDFLEIDLFLDRMRVADRRRR